MAKSDLPVPRRWSGLSVHARGHFLLFDQRSAFHWNAETGARLLFIVVAIEAIRIVAIEWLHPVLPLLILVLLLLAGALGLVRFAARLRLSQIGLYPWSEWSPVEKSYFVQLLVIANVVFPLVFANRLRLILAQPSALATVWSSFVPYLFFGFYQEVVYRGILQSELVRRWGALDRNSERKCVLHLWPSPLVLLCGARLARGSDVRGDLCDRFVLWCSLLAIGQSLDRGDYPRDR